MKIGDAVRVVIVPDMIYTDLVEKGDTGKIVEEDRGNAEPFNCFLVLINHNQERCWFDEDELEVIG